MKLLDRMIFGTARLAGGGCARASRQLIEDCCTAGLMHFDTAPAYGMGAAEQLLGEVLAGDNAAKIHTKAGLPRPGVSALRGWAKWLRSKTGAGGTAAWQPELLEYHAPASAGQYGKSTLQQSVERSRELLRVETLELLLLHAAEPGDIAPQSWEVFTGEQKSGRTKNIGYAHTGPVKAGREGCVVQVAPRESEFCSLSAEPRIFHSVRTSAAIALSRSGAANSALEKIRAELTCRADSATTDLLAAMLLLATRHPNARMIFATTSRTRLASILTEAAAIDLPDAPQ
ncbi:aldo/keto reductase [Altererythrobacter sp. ZODW24]|uniref:aldo/keto reductase n=1 Tax=Altererythrobacter sp. ZODW24 TaxID=2185142 RepID=UPI000DF84F6D|nr:aldo/keto reductase [Altererythrobacter sp. ZODW24]